MRWAWSVLAMICFLSASMAHGDDSVSQHTYESFDGNQLSYREIGAGPLVLMLHGFTANADLNFFGPEIAQKVAAAGYRVVAPDLRGHGASPVDDTPRNWPRDALARDQIALIAHLGEAPHGIVGYSLGAITALRLHLLSRQGDRLVLGGVGDAVADEWNTARNDGFRQALTEAADGADTPGAKAMKARLAASGGTLAGYLGALSSRTYTPRDLLKTFDVPTLVLTGKEDLDNGSGPGLAAIIPGAKHTHLTGTHITAVGDPKFAEEIIAFLAK